MKNLLRLLFGSHAAPPPFRRTGAPSTLQTNSEAINRQQLVMITVRDVMRNSGIPPGWVDCQTLNVSSHRHGTGLYIYMVINHWDERLMRYAMAFQAEIKTRLKRFDPKSAVWVHGISWQLDMADSCPFTLLPDKSYWQTPVAAHLGASTVINTSPLPTSHAPAVPGTMPLAEPADAVEPNNARANQPLASVKDWAQDLAQDLEKLFAVRDEEMKHTQARTPAQVGGFEPTQPSPLNR